jgi:hypothetical protein
VSGGLVRSNLSPIPPNPLIIRVLIPEKGKEY